MKFLTKRSTVKQQNKYPHQNFLSCLTLRSNFNYVSPARRGTYAECCVTSMYAYLCSINSLFFISPFSADNQCPPLYLPEHGGYVCMLQQGTNTKRCRLMCDDGYEHLIRPNPYEECGPNTGWSWSIELTGRKMKDDSFACRSRFSKFTCCLSI